MDKEHLQTYPEKEECSFMKCVLFTKRLDLWVRRYFMIEHFIHVILDYFFLHNFLNFCNFLMF